MDIILAGQRWLVPVLVLGAVAFAGILWSYGSRGPRGVRWSCALLKFLGIAALALCLLEPLRSTQRVRPGANLLAILADNSQGMQIHDAGDALSRGQRMQELLRPAPDDWQSRLAEDFDLRRFQFDVRLQGITDFGELAFEGRSTALTTSLRALGERFKDRPLAGVVLLTDGNATDVAGGPPDLSGLPPIYPVVIGRPDALKDLSLAQVTVSQSDFEDQPVSIQGEVQAPGFRGQPVAVRLRDTDGRIVADETVRARPGDGGLPFALHPKPEKPGVAFFELTVAPLSAADTNAAAAEEATLVNNSRVVAVDRGRGPYRVLYVAGRPNWEFKFLNRAMADDDQIRMVALIRVAKREPRFEFRGRAGETSNPLFRGFGNQNPEEVERYDRPVLVRMNPPGESGESTEFPQTAEELFKYHAIILDDLEAAFFTPDQASLVQRFVAERGGGLLMLGGMESFREGAYHRTPVGDVLPVYLDPRADDAAPPAVPVRFELAREGWLETWARVRDHESGERERLEGMPGFEVVNRVSGIKPGASVVATARDASGAELPALLVQRFGRGRSAAFLIGDYWRWGMRDTTARTDMDKSWRQLARWLVTDAPAPVEIAAEPIPADPLGTVSLQVRVRDARYLPMDNASVTVEVEPVLFGTNTPAGPIRLRAEPSTAEAGLYEATFLPRHAGGFRARALVTNPVGAEHGRAETGWSSNPAADEFRSLVPNVALLEELARRTGGKMVSPPELAALAEELPNRAAPVMEARTVPLWHSAGVFAFALACLVSEWGLRRWKGLP